MFKKLFRKGPKIVSVTSCSSGDFLFVFGLASDGGMYVWNSIECVWLPHRAVDPNAAPAGAK